MSRFRIFLVSIFFEVFVDLFNSSILRFCLFFIEFSYMYSFFVFFFFFKQKTAYEMRISDWSSDVCSSDLLASAGTPFTPNTQHKNFHLGFLVRMLFSALVDADYLDTEHYYDQFESKGSQRAQHRAAPVPGMSELRAELNHYLRGFEADTEVNRVRADILDYARQQAQLEPGLFSLTVPTGGGKTLASLAFALDHALAYGQRRVIFVIPFTSIVEDRKSTRLNSSH